MQRRRVIQSGETAPPECLPDREGAALVGARGHRHQQFSNRSMTLRKSASAFGKVVVAFERMTFGAEEYDAACDRQMEFWLDVIRQEKEGPP